MSRVFVGTERSLDRSVVIKVLPPELAHAVSADRFRQEIRLAARLQHPHIVPLLSAGEADGLLYYTMPLVEGESLRAKLARAGELPVRDAVRLLRDVASALAYAHEHGLVHRDIKPDNVLLSGGEALVTDFGVAKALSASATGSDSGLTSLGVALGTPTYMAPEQAAADPHVDHRADLYAWGCMAYECLTSQPPFTGRQPAALLAAHMAETPEPIGRRRPGLPPGLAALVMRTLEKRPADRPQSASELLQTLDGVMTPSGGTAPTIPVAALKPRRWIRPAVALAGMAFVIGAVTAVRSYRSARAVPESLDIRKVAVLPFRVSGADPSLAYLHEGMVDLLAAKLTGEGGPRAIDPRAAVGAWRSEVKGHEDLEELAARRAAGRLGAGQVLLGSVVGSQSHLVLSAKLLPASGGGASSEATVEGQGDSLPVLLDHLVASLLALGAGQGDQRLASLTTTSLPALRAYLDGQGEYRRGHYSEAVAQLQQAVQLDSSFALAAFALAQAIGWTSFGDRPSAEALAWKLRDRLSPRDRALLESFLGPRGPKVSSGAELLEARARSVESVPDQADAWYYLGDLYYHFGALLGIADAHERSIAAFRRSLALDSTFAGPLGHLVVLLAERGDSAGVRSLGTRYLQIDSTSDEALTTRLRMARLLKDGAMQAEVHAKLDAGTGLDAALFPWEPAMDFADVERAIAGLRRSAATPGERHAIYYATEILEYNRGHPGRAIAAIDSTGLPPEQAAVSQIVGALLWDADTTLGAPAARRLAPLTDAPPAETAERRDEQCKGLFWLESWRLAHGDTHSAERTIARLAAAAVPADSVVSVQLHSARAALLTAWVAVVKGSDAAPKLEVADSILRSVPRSFMGRYEHSENLILARLFAAHGDNQRALTAVRRRSYLSGAFLSTALREEGRLAALTGDRAGAIRAYSQYLAMRPDPDPALRGQVAEVKAELAKLVGERAGR